MENLSAAQLRRALRAVDELDALTELIEYPMAVARLLGDLIPCGVASYNAVDPRRRRAEVAAYPDESVFEGGAEIFAAYAHQNPLVGRNVAGDGRARSISDFLGLRELHRTELYDYVYRPLGIEYQLAIGVTSPLRPGEVIGLTVGRDHRDFDAGERELLDALRPHFRATLERLGQRALLDSLLDLGSSSSGGWMVVVGGGETVVAVGAAAAGGLGVEADGRLPAPLRRWLRSDPRAKQVVLGGRPFGVRALATAIPGLVALILTPAEPHPSPEQLRALGLTRRQAEVLALAVRGLRSAEIAAELGLSTRTVEKHLESIYLRLGVRNRVEAVAVALGRGPSDHPVGP